MDISIWIFLAALSLVVVIVVAVMRRKREPMTDLRTTSSTIYADDYSPATTNSGSLVSDLITYEAIDRMTRRKVYQDNGSVAVSDSDTSDSSGDNQPCNESCCDRSSDDSCQTESDTSSSDSCSSDSADSCSSDTSYDTGSSWDSGSSFDTGSSSDN